MKKICFFIGNISSNGGTERTAVLVANKLSKIGYDITILSIRGKKSYYQLEKNITLRFLYEKEIKGLKSVFIIPFLLRKKLKQEKYDYIIDVDTIFSFFSIPASIKTKTEVISWEHFNYYFDIGIKRRKWGRILAAKYAKYIITLTEEDKIAFSKNLKLNSKIEYIYNSTPYPEEKRSECTSKFAISIGRLTDQKGFDKLLDIWRKIEERDKDWILYIIGSGEDKEKLLKQKENLNLERVIFVENTKNIKEYYKKASIYLMTSRFEGLPMTLIEAQSFGLPIISYDIKTGPRDVISDNKDGYLIEEDNQEQFVEKFLELANNRDKIEEFSKEAYKNSKRFHLDNIIDRWIKVLK